MGSNLYILHHLVIEFDIITIFPDIFNSYFNESILKRAQKNKLIEINVHNLRDFTLDKHQKVDDRPFGGGPGMVLKVEPIIKAINSISKKKRINKKDSLIILFTPTGKQFDSKLSDQMAKKYKNLIMICGRYEGYDERIKKVLKADGWQVKEISIGPYVLTGGELAAMVLLDSVARRIPGVLGKSESVEEKRYGVGVPVYTRPEVLVYPIKNKRISDGICKIKKYSVPKVLLSGNHKLIDEWRKKQAHQTQN